MADGQGYSAGNLNFVVQVVEKETNDSLDRMNKNLKTSAFSLTKLVNRVYFLRNYTKQMFSTVGNMLKLAVDYTETLNLWQVAMRNNREEADEFVKTMNRAYGISTQTLMNYQAIFRNMLSSLGGLSENTSYALSEYLTQMAIDYASLYNTSIQKAMTTFQSVLSGQVRPIRSIAGYDITETTIFQLYQQLGGTKTMRQLSQTEKRLLRIYAVFQQMESSGAIGDLNETLGNTANQMRILSESSKELKTWFGLLLEDMVKPMLPYLNAFVITLTNIVKALAQTRGVELFERGAVESVQEINDALDETQGKLLSFDRFEALNAGGEEDTNLLGIDENLLAGLSQYSSILSDVTGKAQELADAWSRIFVEYDSEGNIVGLTQKTYDLGNAIKFISLALGSIIAINIGSKILQLIGNVGKMTGVLGYLHKSFLEIATSTKGVTSNVTLLGKAFSFILNHPIILIISAVAGLLIYLYNTNESFRESVNNLFKSLEPLLGLLGGLLGDLLEPIGSILGVIIDLLSPLATFLVKGLVVAINSIVLSLLPLAYTLEFVIKLVESLVQGFADLVTFNWKDFGKNQKDIWGNWKSTAFAKSAISNSIDSISAFKTGGQVEDGIFTMNKGEIIGNFDDGSTVVANNQQIISGIQQGVYSAVVSAMKQSGNGGVGDVYLNGRKVGQTTARYSHNENVRTGLVRATR